jgi:hypothetical protein
LGCGGRFMPGAEAGRGRDRGQDKDGSLHG